MDEIRRWFFEVRAEETIKNLIHHGFEAIGVSDRMTACEEVLKRVPANRTVGLGGSVTLREIGLVEKLEGRGNVLYDHWKQGISKDESFKIRKAQQSSDVYLTSANALTLQGEIVNVDGFGNRVSSMIFGPKEVIVVAGKNKIVQDVSEAIARIKNWAAPMNAKRFGIDTPCVELGRCVNCDSPQRICRATVILDRRPFATKMLVILIGEELGF